MKRRRFGLVDGLAVTEVDGFSHASRRGIAKELALRAEIHGRIKLPQQVLDALLGSESMSFVSGGPDGRLRWMFSIRQENGRYVAGVLVLDPSALGLELGKLRVWRTGELVGVLDRWGVSKEAPVEEPDEPPAVEEKKEEEDAQPSRPAQRRHAAMPVLPEGELEKALEDLDWLISNEAVSLPEKTLDRDSQPVL